MRGGAKKGVKKPMTVCSKVDLEIRGKGMEKEKHFLKMDIKQHKRKRSLQTFKNC